MAPVEAVIFDWGGTLTPWHDIDLAGQWRAWASVEHPDSPDAAADLVQRLLEAERVVWGRVKHEHLSGTLSDVLDVAGATHSRSAHAAYEAFWDPHTYTDEQASPLFDALRAAGLGVGVLSNTLWSRDYHEAIFARDDVLHRIDAGVYSSEISWAKPHPEAFEAAALALGVQDLSRCVYVGDRLFEDVFGAGQAGMQTVWLPHSRIPLDQHGHTDGEPDAVVHELAEVMAVVDAWNQGLRTLKG